MLDTWVMGQGRVTCRPWSSWAWASPRVMGTSTLPAGTMCSMVTTRTTTNSPARMTTSRPVLRGRRVPSSSRPRLRPTATRAESRPRPMAAIRGCLGGSPGAGSSMIPRQVTLVPEPLRPRAPDRLDSPEFGSLSSRSGMLRQLLLVPEAPSDGRGGARRGDFEHRSSLIPMLGAELIGSLLGTSIRQAQREAATALAAMARGGKSDGSAGSAAARTQCWRRWEVVLQHHAAVESGSRAPRRRGPPGNHDGRTHAPAPRPPSWEEPLVTRRAHVEVGGPVVGDGVVDEADQVDGIGQAQPGDLGLEGGSDPRPRPGSTAGPPGAPRGSGRRRPPAGRSPSGRSGGRPRRAGARRCRGARPAAPSRGPPPDRRRPGWAAPPSWPRPGGRRGVRCRPPWRRTGRSGWWPGPP